METPSHPLSDKIEPEALEAIIPASPCSQLSLAISAKRQADALERIADALDRLAPPESPRREVGQIASRKREQSLSRRYEGPIHVGQTFVWEPDKPHAWARVEVLKYDPINHRVSARVIAGKDKGKDYWNEVERFREACWQGPEAPVG